MLLSAIGVLLLALTVLDALLTVLDAGGRSIFSAKAYRLFWWCWRHLAKLLPYAVAQRALSLAAPLMIALIISLWIGGIVTGFALIFYGGLSVGDLVTGGGSQPGLSAAFRLSWVTLSTIGFVEISPSNMAYSVAVALEALLGSVILTFSITYFLSVHRSILDYDRLVADLHHRMDRNDDPMETVAERLSADNMEGLERWLERLHDGLIGMHQGLSRYPIVYFYRPQARERSLPRTLQALGRIADGLTYCLPEPSGPGSSPALRALKAGMADLVSDLREAYVPVKTEGHPKPVSRPEFEAALRGAPLAVVPSVRRYVEISSTLGRLTGHTIDPGRAYDRYRKWLPAAQRTQAFVAAVSHDLGYDEDLRPRRSSYLLGLLSRGPKQRPQPLQIKGTG
ncbi:two pore domain potassium channel family protein [Pseudoblastomonas halimionae]|uniref:Two pore domain potassium channel family protein n=1 Tax=Alteriqipengyuania halimionae TaxID=1926630 RepID=A0A6I4U3R0_9SPHN|nr:two pore domain potassium channel family protein [Alteriqipengyuania halimionae]MXP10578.1 hypothetical protein [Alteriqipengyuania halimionae]